MNEWFVNFYINWTTKAQSITGLELADVYDKYITYFVIYNNLYNQIPDKLVASGVSLPKRIYDVDLATKHVVKYIGGNNILTTLSNNGLDNEINAIITFIENEFFYIKITRQGRQRHEDLRILDDLKSVNPDLKAIAVLKVIYYVRCNIIHGHKDFQGFQRILIEPLTNILRVLNQILYNRLIL